MADTKTAEAKRYLIFKLEKEEYGIDISKVTTIIEKDMEITRVPKLPCFMKGVINLRGDIIPVVSIRLRFDLTEDVYNSETRIIIIKMEEASVGLLVDSATEVIEMPDSCIENSSNVVSDISLDYIIGVGRVGDKVVTLLNIESLVALRDD